MVKAAIKPSIRTVLCPTCGGNVEIRGLQHTRSAVCIQCLTILDPTTPALRILQQFDERMRVIPLIPLGSRGKFHGTQWEVIGFQVRTITVEGIDYSWHEYLLFNPYKGFRYLTQYEGHWNWVTTVRAVPTEKTSSGRRAVGYLGNTYAHFQHASARTTFVMGEFPWQVRVGDVADADDFVSPPYMLSAETTEGEVTWSHGEYMPGAAVWQAFGLPGGPPRASGVFANQPSPYKGKLWDIWKTWLLLMALWVAVFIGLRLGSPNVEAFRQTFRYAQNSPGEHSLVTDLFDLKGSTSNVVVQLRTDLRNNWAYFNMALINEGTGQGWDFGRELSFYSGRDEEGNWTEGKPGAEVTIPAVPAGRYYLRIEPEMAATPEPGTSDYRQMDYEIVVRRGVPGFFWLFMVLLLLQVPPVVRTLQSAAFEGSRWAQSDYGGGDS